MSVDDLVALRDKVQAELSRKIEVERGALEKQIAALSKLEAGAASKRGDASAAPRGRKKPGGRKASGNRAAKQTSVAPKYRGPGGETWTGRGRAPRWLTALEADGKKRESYLITR